jgi:hypothetical protein
MHLAWQMMQLKKAGFQRISIFLAIISNAAIDWINEIIARKYIRSYGKQGHLLG